MILHRQGTILGPSDYADGVVVRFSKTLTYPCSNPGLKVLSAPEGDFVDEERDDFENWLFLQSNVMHSFPLEHQRSAYRQDAEWHRRHPRNPYKSKA